MDLGEALIERLSAASAVTDIFADRIFWTYRPQGSELPALVLTQAGGPPEEEDLDGQASIVESRVQGSSFAATHIEARAGAKAFADALRGEAEIGDLLFWNADVERPRDLGDSASGRFVHQTVQDVILRHSPAA